MYESLELSVLCVYACVRAGVCVNHCEYNLEVLEM